jgi:hypothetical protein
VYTKPVLWVAPKEVKERLAVARDPDVVRRVQVNQLSVWLLDQNAFLWRDLRAEELQRPQRHTAALVDTSVQDLEVGLVGIEIIKLPAKNLLLQISVAHWTSAFLLLV